VRSSIELTYLHPALQEGRCTVAGPNNKLID
jgi:hypothetical protein